MRQVAAFLGVEVDDGEVTSLAHHCSFDQMKVNPAVNNETLLDAGNTKSEGIKFMRKGQVCRRGNSCPFAINRAWLVSTTGTLGLRN